jgi:hypothetical protein
MWPARYTSVATPRAFSFNLWMTYNQRLLDGLQESRCCRELAQPPSEASLSTHPFDGSKTLT